MNSLIRVLDVLSLVLPLLIAVAYLTAVERKMMGHTQRREGPDSIGFAGLLQPFADGLKLFAKETMSPTNADTFVFFIAPSATFVLSLMGWAVVPFSSKVVVCDLNLGIMYVLSVSSLNVFGILFAGWSSNSKYAYLGGLRSAAQMVSYEISIGFMVLNVIICSESFNIFDVVHSQKEAWHMLSLLPVFLIFCITILAETNRHPFDLPEAEAELVSGYNVEYSSMTFALFFLGEYSNILFMSAFLVLLFLGGWLPFGTTATFKLLPESCWLSLKIIFSVLFFITARAGLPRYRYDQLMYVGWKAFLPFGLGYLLFIVGLLKLSFFGKAVIFCGC